MDQSLMDPDLINNWGSLRLSKVQFKLGYDNNFKKQACPLDIDYLTDIYTTWRDLKEIVPIKYVYEGSRLIDFKEINSTPELYSQFVYEHFNKHIDVSGSVRDWCQVPYEVNEWRFPIAVKRGNDQYVKIIKERLSELINQEPIIFFDRSWGIKKTNMLYITLTVDPKNCSYDMGYLEFGTWFNKFITNLRNQFGDIVYIRSWQSQESGYCHAHAILYFSNTEFTAVKWINDKGKESFRLPSRSKYRSSIKKAWKWGSCDIVCVDNTQEAFKDLLKYVTRDLQGGESDLTNALLWYFQRQAFAISRTFVDKVWKNNQSITMAEPCNADLINPNMYNSNFPLIRIEIYPTIRLDIFSNPVQTSFHNWKDPPPLTEFDINKLEFLVSDCDLVECKSNSKLGCPVFMYRRR